MFIQGAIVNVAIGIQNRTVFYPAIFENAKGNIPRLVEKACRALPPAIFPFAVRNTARPLDNGAEAMRRRIKAFLALTIISGAAVCFIRYFRDDGFLDGFVRTQLEKI